ncbi:glycosyltransferase family 2 protein [Lysobacter sp. TY2-98]|uniref:glycosyltransferase n=1 Tax=Lysobacter sp. TY2-98 TaxID=2290922 RepID=UPI0021015A13|nr:glycosyltransferase family 2 protein [Lysobacter sp. TY2-98]
MKDAAALVDSEILIVFDADYVPSRGLIRQLVAPFFDPEVGAVMGRVVPLNADRGLLTRLLDIERSGGYQVDQQARMTLQLVPQYGGTTGGVRLAALKAIGGWSDDVLAEDTELTYRLLLRGWKTAYQNRAECYEEVPENWQVRSRQIARWAKGHNQSLARHFWGVIGSRRLRGIEKIDAVLLLCVYLMPALTLSALTLIILLFYLGRPLPFDGLLLGLGVFLYGSLGNFAAFFELAAGCYLDDKRASARLLPLNLLGFVTSVVAVTRATLDQLLFDRLFRREFVWHKTARYRTP